MQPEDETMGDFVKSHCPHCGQSIEYPAEGAGQIVPCPTCEKPITLMPGNPPPEFSSIVVSTAPAQMSKEQNTGRPNLSKLTEETIRAKTSAGNTPVHLAAKSGNIDLIPSHLLSVELFMDRNNDGNTPLHIAAMYGTLNQVPRQFLTKETLTIPQTPHYAPDGFHITGSGYRAQSPTVLHVAAFSGHLDQIPKEFFTPEFLLIEATGYRQTVLECIVKNKRLDLLPANYAVSESWNLKGGNGQTPREILEIRLELEAEFAARWEARQAERQGFISRVRVERASWKPTIQTELSKQLPIFSDESLRAIEVKSGDGSKTYVVNLLDYTCTCPHCLEIHSGVPARDFGRLCKHIILALRTQNLVAQLPAIAQGIAQNGYPDRAFGIYPGRFAEDLSLIHI